MFSGRPHFTNLSIAHSCRPYPEDMAIIWDIGVRVLVVHRYVCVCQNLASFAVFVSHLSDLNQDLTK